jgi:type IV pilus assembly protein PilA
MGKYVAAIDVQNGALIVTYGNDVNAAITALTLTLTPYETPSSTVVWRCGNAAAPTGLNLLGTAGGSNVAVYIAPTLPDQYMPSACRP